MSERFAADVLETLVAAGWSAQGRTDEEVAAAVNMVCDQVGRHGARIRSFPLATQVLKEFGGLYVNQDGPGLDLRRRAFAIDPTHVAATAETLADLGRILDTSLFPVGMEGDHDSILAIDEAGRIFALDHAGVWFLGASMDEAITGLITGSQPPRLDESGHW